MNTARKPRLSRSVWLHGDQLANGKLAYCAVCGQFAVPAHFSEHASTANHDWHDGGLRALEALAKVAYVPPSRRGNLFEGGGVI